MNFNNLNGSFGGSKPEKKTVARRTSRRKRNNISKHSGNRLTVRNCLKIMLLVLIVILVIAFIANWECILSAVYYGFILPLLKFIGSVAIVIAIIAAGFEYVKIKIYNWFR